MTLGERIRAARVKAGLSQPELAGRVGVAKSFISMLETGKRPRVGSDILARIAVALNTTIDALQSGAEPPDTSEPPVELWAALHWPQDLVARHVANWPRYSEARRLEFVQRARRLYEEQEALQADMHDPQPAVEAV